MTSVRRATSADARAISQVRVDTWRATYPGIVPQDVLDSLDVDRGESWFREAIVADGYATFVTERSGLVVGFVSLGPCRELRHTGELYAIYVVPDAWGTGAGSALMIEALEWLFGRWDEAVLWVAEENWRARRFYEHYRWIADESRVEEVAPGAFVPEVRYRLSALDRR